MYEIRANKNLCPPTLANYLTDWSPVVCGYCEGAHPPHPIKRPLAEKKNSSIATLFYSLLEDYIFSPHFGMTKWGRTVFFFEGGPRVLSR